MDKKELFFRILLLIYTITTIISFVYTIIFYRQSLNNPFDKEYTPEEISQYINKQYTYITETKKCLCGNEIVNDFCNEEHFLSGCLEIIPNMTYNKDKYANYQMEEKDCIYYKNLIMNQTNFKNVFILYSEGIGQLDFWLLILYCFMFLFSSLFLLIDKKCPPYSDSIKKCIQILNNMILLIFWMLQFIILFFLILSYRIGNSKDYYDFLECPGINKFKFIETFKSFDDYYDTYILFAYSTGLSTLLLFPFTIQSCKNIRQI